MADSDPITWQLALLLQSSLSKVRVSNGYRTDIGASVLIEDAQTPTDAAVLPTVIDVNLTTRSSDTGTNRRQRSVDFTVQAAIACTLANAKEMAHRVLADIERVLDQQGDFAPKGIRMARATKAEILKRPDGMNAMVVEVTGTANYLQ
jgi:hypothetical protein